MVIFIYFVVSTQVLGRAHSNSSSRNSSLSPPASTSSNSSTSTVRVGGQGIVAAAADPISAPPRPLPRSQVPPKPKPRTSVPQARPLYPTQPPGDQQHLLDPHDCYGHNSTLRLEIESISKVDGWMDYNGNDINLDNDTVLFHCYYYYSQE